MALVDTADRPPVGRLDIDLTNLDTLVATDPLDVAQTTLARCLAVALQAGASAERLRWKGRLSVQNALRRGRVGDPGYRKTTST